MPISTQNLRYGWVALATLVVTGTTIYVANNTRRQVKAVDIIELYLGTYERCLATQTGTNADGSPVYSVSPTNLIQTWTSNVYTTNGVTIYTNTVTNTVGWSANRNYLITLDSKIKALVPYYADTNTVYDGSTQIVMLTVTGLWASLQIGDKTNKFTREPAWTNPVSTNWTVNYTSYWPSTSGVATNIIYTSDYQQVVNYAASWTATGGHVWVASSNWQSAVVTITNAATYGDYPWQIYEHDLVERYKALNALKISQRSVSLYGFPSNYTDLDGFGSNWAVAKGAIDAVWPGSLISASLIVHMQSLGRKAASNDYRARAFVNNLKLFAIEGLNTNFSKTIRLFVKGDADHWAYTGISNRAFNSFGYPVSTNWSIWASSNCGYSGSAFGDYLIGDDSFPQPGWCAEPTEIALDYTEIEGWEIIDYNAIVDWQFNYATNKYW